MSMNIKNPETHKLAQKLAKLTGESLTEAVTQAIRERLERLSKRKPDAKLIEDLGRIAHDIASRMSPETKALDIDELLYDENGLPK
jgi:antitoxin VapB